MLAVLAAGLLLRRRRRMPRIPRLAPPLEMNGDAPMPAPLSELRDLAIDLTLDVTGATRSVMMFTLQYRLTLANRTGQAVTDLNVAVLLACARAGTSNAASAGAAQRLAKVDRIGPHQSRTITGEVQLPLSHITPLHQGNLTLFVPLMHVTLEGERQAALTRSFVIGTPSAAGTGRLHPIVIHTQPGSIPGLHAQRITVPTVSAAA